MVPVADILSSLSSEDSTNCLLEPLEIVRRFVILARVLDWQEKRLGFWMASSGIRKREAEFELCQPNFLGYAESLRRIPISACLLTLSTGQVTTGSEVLNSSNFSMV